MGKIIVSQLDLNTEQASSGTVILCALSLLAAWATYAFFKNAFKEGFDRDDVAVGFFGNRIHPYVTWPHTLNH